jgi:hypothetical protein
MSRNYDSSALIQRKAQQAIAGGFLSQFNTTNGTPVQGWGSRPTVGIKDASILAAVKVGAMTEYTRYNTCIAISPGCPCGPLLDSLIHPPFLPAIPGSVTGITFTVGSIVVRWTAPTTGTGPFVYDVTPFLNGVAQATVRTTDTTYRFTNLVEWQPYTFTVCASNAAGSGPLAPSGVCLAPPADLSALLASLTSNTPIGNINTASCMSYVINCVLNDVLKTVVASNVGPTRASRLMYLYIASIAQAWNWVTADTNITGMHDNWDWTYNKASAPLSANDAIVWFICATKYINSFISTAPSMFTCPANVEARIHAAGDWDGWVSAWSAWYAGRMSDGSTSATSTQPTSSANWNQTVVVDGHTVNQIAGFPQPQEWTRLTVNGNRQNYLTHAWDTVQSTCLTEAEEMDIQGAVAPVTGADRDAEIDMLMNLAANLNDQEKMIAEFWAGSTTNYMSPPLQAIWLCKEYLRTSSASCQTMIYSLLDLSIHLFEGSRVTWRLKAQHMQARPIQEIRRRYAGQPVISWNGTVDGAQWVPYQPANFITPPFADFPSGHSHFMKAFSLTMTKWFGASITPHPIICDMETLFSPCVKSNESTTFGTFTLPAGSSTVQPGIAPSAPVVLTFSTWDDIANQAGMSRLYGGIHAASAHYASQTTATLVDGYIQSTWNIATSS